MLVRILLIFLLVGFGYSIYAQHHEHDEAHHEDFMKHRIGFEIGSTYIPNGFKSEKGDQNIYMPTLGLEYFYRFSHKWSAGGMADLELGQYLIPFGQDELSRDKAFIFAVVGKYEIIPLWSVFAGPGIEIEHHKNFPVFRLGSDYEFLLGKGWDLSPTLSYDYKEEYSSWSLMLSFGKKF